MTSTILIVRTFQDEPKKLPEKWMASTLCSWVRLGNLFSEVWEVSRSFLKGQDGWGVLAGERLFAEE